MKSPFSLVRRGVHNPGKVPSYLGRKLSSATRRGREELFRRKYSIPRQKPRVTEFVDQDEFTLVILDSCRYDMFAAAYADFLGGDLSAVWSSGRWTGEYIHNMWDRYHDLTYVNAAPVVSDFYFENRASGPNPEQYFREVIPVWEGGWDDDLGTTPAEEVTETALRVAADSDHPRLVVHYIQPHFPYVGDYRPDALEGGYAHIRERADADGDRMTDQWIARVESGDLTNAEIRRAYKSNLEYVLSEVQRLIRALDCPIVVTADHGEHLGEGGRYLHEESSKYTRTVPWFRVESVVGESETNPLDEVQRSDGENESSVDDDVVEERLADLGYIE
ncbi:sulfatase-like hydrolase/transferase [Halococcus qingdaonensis]|uniref:sulfatase-like hydrolase/transferase n=1 Tax=Halococcus qingdaonensis TaxID=224402 RepID=UPI002117207B|nr:sulfatase-like hydrolase/transferase [Halococcus qingdaonensis]